MALTSSDLYVHYSHLFVEYLGLRVGAGSVRYPSPIVKRPTRATMWDVQPEPNGSVDRQMELSLTATPNQGGMSCNARRSGAWPSPWEGVDGNTAERESAA